MATATTATVWTNSSAANFRAWASWLDGLWETFGWVNVIRTFNTGTSWSDVSAPTTSNDEEVYAVYRMNDTLQSTKPLYFRIGYGASGAAANPGIRITIGTGHSGSGVITGQLHDTGSTLLATTANANSMTHYASGANNRFCVSMANAGTSFSTGGLLTFGIERRVDSAGAVDDNGFLMFWTNNGTSRFNRPFQAAASPFPSPAGGSTKWHFPCIGSAAQQVWEERILVTPSLFCTPLEIGLNLVAAPANSYSAGSQFTVSLLGSNHTYIGTGHNNISDPFDGNSNVLIACIRYE